MHGMYDEGTDKWSIKGPRVVLCFSTCEVVYSVFAPNFLKVIVILLFNLHTYFSVGFFLKQQFEIPLVVLDKGCSAHWWNQSFLKQHLEMPFMVLHCSAHWWNQSFLKQKLEMPFMVLDKGCSAHCWNQSFRNSSLIYLLWCSIKVVAHIDETTSPWVPSFGVQVNYKLLIDFIYYLLSDFLLMIK